MKRILVLTACVALCGCAHFTTTQKDQRDANGLTTITTKVSATTLFSAKSELSKFKATQTEKTQGAEVGALNQQGGTNVVAALEAIAKIVGALPK
jgi:hypothetical protein